MVVALIKARRAPIQPRTKTGALVEIEWRTWALPAGADPQSGQLLALNLGMGLRRESMYTTGVSATHAGARSQGWPCLFPQTSQMTHGPVAHQVLQATVKTSIRHRLTLIGRQVGGCQWMMWVPAGGQWRETAAGGRVRAGAGRQHAAALSRDCSGRMPLVWRVGCSVAMPTS